MSQDSTPGPSSPSSRSYLDATSAIDDLTRSLTDYSRVSTPEPPSHASDCSCNTDDSEYTKAWMALKTKLESRLVLSAGALHAALTHTWHMSTTCRGWASLATETRGLCTKNPGPISPSTSPSAVNSSHLGRGTYKQARTLGQ